MIEVRKLAAGEDYFGCLPLLRWAGSKARALPRLSRYLPTYSGKYVELFSGSACLFFRLCEGRAVIADANPDLISFYRVVKRRPDLVYDRAVAIKRNPKEYYEARSRFNVANDPLEKAVLFFYLNRNCFNGIYRTNLSGQFNVPFSNLRVPQYPDREQFLRSCKKLRSARTVCSDFEHVVRNNVSIDDFVYLDPPYYVPDVRTFREYSSRHFGEDDVRRLKSILATIDKKGAKFLLSYPDCSLARNLAMPWQKKEISILRSISAKTASRQRANELLIANYDLAAASKFNAH